MDRRVQERTAELVQVNETLAASQARFEAIFNSMGDGVVFADPERRIALVNSAMEAMLGYRAEELLGRTTEILYADPADYEKQGQDRYNPVATTSQAYFGIKYRRQDGTVFDAEGLGMPVKDVHGHLLGFVGLVRDVTVRKQAEEALRESEARLDLALRSSEMGVWYLDLVENKRFFDDQVCHLLGLDPAKFTGKAEEFFNAVHPQDREAVKAALARSTEHGMPYESEYRTTWPDGSIHHITARGKLVYDHEGRPVRINGLVWDVTERKRAEARLQANLAAMNQLHEISTLLVQQEDLPSLLEKFLAAAIGITGADKGNVQLLDPDSGTLKIYTHVGFEQPFLDFFNAVHGNMAACGTAMAHGERVVVEDVTKSPIFAGTPALEVQRAAEVRAVQSTPIISHRGTILGMISTHWRQPHRPEKHVLLMVDLLARLAAELVERARTEAALRESEERLRLLGDNLPDSAVYQYVHELDGKVRFLYMSEGIERLNGVPAQEALQDAGALHRQILPEYYGPLVEAEKQSARELSDFEMEVPMRRSDGEVRWMLLHSRPRRLPDGSTVWDGVQIDVTERKRAEAERQKLVEELQKTKEELQAANEELMVQAKELQVQGEELRQSHDKLEQRVAERTAEVVGANERMKYLTAQVLTVQEQERKRISMDLHDDLGQSLLVLRMQLNAMLRKSPSEPPIRQGLEESAGYLIEIIDKVRNLSHALSPAALGKLNLTEAVNSLLKEFHKYSDIGTEADVDEVGPTLSKEARIGIYRVLQEFLNNVHKHAQATKVKVAIKAIEDCVAVTMEDNGIGFDLEKMRGTIRKPGGLGLLSMEGRVQMLGGQLSLHSREGRGTHLYFEIPLTSGTGFISST